MTENNQEGMQEATADEQVEKLKEELGGLQAQNQQLYAEVLKAGANIDPVAVFAMKFDVFLSMLPVKERYVLETRFERAMNESLQGLASEARKASLLAGVHMDPATGKSPLLTP